MFLDPLYSHTQGQLSFTTGVQEEERNNLLLLVWDPDVYIKNMYMGLLGLHSYMDPNLSLLSPWSQVLGEEIRLFAQNSLCKIFDCAVFLLFILLHDIGLIFFFNMLLNVY